MGFDSKGLDDYIDVAQRIAEFRVKHPEGSLQPLNPEHPFEIRELAGTDKNGMEVRGTFIIYTAAAYRSSDDQRPGVGCAYEVFPGRTPYTAGSELQNAETAAWGRAIVAVLAADTRAGIASQQEVRNRQAESGQSAADAFENAATARPVNHGPARLAAQSDAWYDNAILQSANLKTEAEGQKLWRESAAAARDGRCTPGEATHIQNLINARIDDRRKELSDAILSELSEGDEWRLTVEALSEAGEARNRLEEVQGLSAAGQMDADRADLLGRAIVARYPKAAVKDLPAKAEAA